MEAKKELELYAGKTALDIFKPDGVETILNHIRKEATDFTPNTATDKGRKEIASQARRVSTSKSMLDEARKALVADWTRQTKVVNESGKALRDGCDSLRDEIRKPLTEWEAAKQARIVAEQLAEKINNDHKLALEENSLIDRQKEIERKEAELGAQRQAILDKELAGRLEKERLESEERFRAEVIEQEKKNTAILIQKAEDDRIKALADAQFEAEKFERDKTAAVEAARIDEQKRIADQYAETERLREEEEAKQVKAAQNVSHRKAINNTAVECLVMSTGIDNDTAKKVIIAIAKGDIAKVSINY